jgi:DNA-binding NtrC family response regulator
MADIQIVDDEPTIQQLMAMILDGMGHDVVEQSSNGEAALKFYESRERKPDLVIIDHRMPLMSGLDLAREILGSNPHQRILFLSADDSIRNEVTSLGVKHFLEKPSDLKTIRKAVTDALGR